MPDKEFEEWLCGLDAASLKAMERQAERRAQIAFEAACEGLVFEVGVKETIERLRLEIDALTEFER